MHFHLLLHTDLRKFLYEDVSDLFLVLQSCRFAVHHFLRVIYLIYFVYFVATRIYSEDTRIYNKFFYNYRIT